MGVFHPGSVVKRKHKLWSRCAAELVGTYFLVYTVCCNTGSMPLSGALCVGGMLLTMVYTLGPVSGCHLNPAVTYAVYLSGRNKISPRRAGFYVVSQLFGALLAGLSHALFFRKLSHLKPNPEYSSVVVFAVEWIYAIIFLFVVLNVATTNPMPGSAHNEYYGIAIGFSVVSAAVAIGGISNCCLNPAVALGTLMASVSTGRLESEDLVAYPTYFLAPMAGSVVAPLLFYLVRRYDEYDPRNVGLFKVVEIGPSIDSPTISSGMSTPEGQKSSTSKTQNPITAIADFLNNPGETSEEAD